MITETINISDDNYQELRWAVFVPDENGKPHHIGQVNKIAAARVPGCHHKALSSPRSNALFLTSKGHWATTLQGAADLLATKPLIEFVVTGALLDLFPFLKLTNDSDVKLWGEYLVFWNLDGCWDVREIPFVAVS